MIFNNNIKNKKRYRNSKSQSVIKLKELEIFFNKKIKWNDENDKLNIYSVINLKHKVLFNFSNYLQNQIQDSIKFIKKKKKNYYNYKMNKNLIKDQKNDDYILKLNYKKKFSLIENKNKCIKIKDSDNKIKLPSFIANKDIHERLEKIKNDNDYLKKELIDFKNVAKKYSNNSNFLTKDNKRILSIINEKPIKYLLKYNICAQKLINFKDIKFNNILHYLLKEENIKYLKRFVEFLLPNKDFKKLFNMKNINRNSPNEIIHKKLFFNNYYIYEFLKVKNLLN